MAAPNGGQLVQQVHTARRALESAWRQAQGPWSDAQSFQMGRHYIDPLLTEANRYAEAVRAATDAARSAIQAL